LCAVGTESGRISGIRQVQSDARKCEGKDVVEERVGCRHVCT